MPFLSNPSIQSASNALRRATDTIGNSARNATQKFAGTASGVLNKVTPITNTVGGIAGQAAGATALLGEIVGGKKGARLFQTAGNLSKIAVGANVLSTAQARLSAFGLKKGGDPLEDHINEVEQKYGGTYSNQEEDWRVRISVSESSGIFYMSENPGIMSPLIDTKGVIFPYTPTISLTYSSTYSPTTPTHSVYPMQAFSHSEVTSINITCDFTAQTVPEADYVLAAIHFFRSASKMFFGSSDTKNEGAPPPVLRLNGMGTSMFTDVPVVIQSFQFSMPETVDYVTTSNNTRIPSASTVTLALVPQYSRSKLSEFNLDRFASGELLSRGFM